MGLGQWLHIDLENILFLDLATFQPSIDSASNPIYSISHLPLLTDEQKIN